MAAQSPSSSPQHPPPIPFSSQSSKPNVPTKRLQSLSPPPPPTGKKPHPFPWTHEETVNLIGAYQEKWYSLKKGQLKASQWEEVAVTVSARCGASSDETSKTGTQCRHKMEKLRKRYRAEKQRPGPSAWPYFNLMDRMESGPLPISVALPLATFNRQHYGDDDEYDDGEEEDDDDSDYGGAIGYGGRTIKRRKFDSRVSGDRRRLGEFGEMVDGFLRNGRKLGGYGRMGSGCDAKLKSCSNSSRFQKRKSTFKEEEEDDDDEDEEEERRVIGVGGKGEREEKNDGWLVELAGQMREFAEMFVRLERRKIEVMRETERNRLEMENKRMEMILLAQQKTVDIISKAFASSPPPPSGSSSPPSDHNSRKLKVVEEEGT